MHPWLLQNPSISAYGACIVVGIVLAWLLARRQARRAGLDASHVDLLVPLLVAAGLAGAWTFGSLTDAVVDASAHGTVLLGSLLVATAAGIVFALIARIPLGILGDIAAAPVALGISCGRVGCFFAGCCYGRPCAADFFPVSVRFPHDSFAWRSQDAQPLFPPPDASLPVYPVQLYEAVLCLFLCLVLARGFQNRKISGERFLMLGIGYSIIRFSLEFLRADNPPVAFNLTFSQGICGLVTIVCAITFLWRRRYADARSLPLPAPTA